MKGSVAAFSVVCFAFLLTGCNVKKGMPGAQLSQSRRDAGSGNEAIGIPLSGPALVVTALSGLRQSTDGTSCPVAPDEQSTTGIFGHFENANPALPATVAGCATSRTYVLPLDAAPDEIDDTAVIHDVTVTPEGSHLVGGDTGEGIAAVSWDDCGGGTCYGRQILRYKTRPASELVDGDLVVQRLWVQAPGAHQPGGQPCPEASRPENQVRVVGSMADGRNGNRNICLELTPAKVVTPDQVPHPIEAPPSPRDSGRPRLAAYGAITEIFGVPNGVTCPAGTVPTARTQNCAAQWAAVDSTLWCARYVDIADAASQSLNIVRDFNVTPRGLHTNPVAWIPAGFTPIGGESDQVGSVCNGVQLFSVQYAAASSLRQGMRYLHLLQAAPTVPAGYAVVGAISNGHPTPAYQMSIYFSAAYRTAEY